MLNLYLEIINICICCFKVFFCLIGVNVGYYIIFVKYLLNGLWYYYNDELVS